MESLRGGVAVVTGGAGAGAGLGQGLVRRLAAEGMRVAILDVDGDAAAALAKELRAGGTDALACLVDVRDPDTLDAAAVVVQDTFGGCNVLCAHVGGGGQAPFEALTIQMWRDAFDTMVIGTVATVQSFLPLIRRTSGPRRIVLTASAAALAPGRFQGGYRAAKAAVTSIGETLDLELGPEGIGTTVAFPSGMLPSAVIAARLHDDGSASALAIPAEMQAMMAALAEEMAPDPTDITTGDAAAQAIIAAVIAGERYVVTHGVTVERNHRRRMEQLDDAFADLAERNYGTSR